MQLHPERCQIRFVIFRQAQHSAGRATQESGVAYFPTLFLIFLLFCLASSMKNEDEKDFCCFCTHTQSRAYSKTHFPSASLSPKEGRQQSFHFPACLPKVITHIKDEVYHPNCLCSKGKKKKKILQSISRCLEIIKISLILGSEVTGLRVFH